MTWRIIYWNQNCLIRYFRKMYDLWRVQLNQHRQSEYKRVAETSFFWYKKKIMNDYNITRRILIFVWHKYICLKKNAKTRDACTLKYFEALRPELNRSGKIIGGKKVFKNESYCITNIVSRKKRRRIWFKNLIFFDRSFCQEDSN